MICCFYADHFVLPLPPGHRFPMDKYRQLRERVATWPQAIFGLREAPPAQPEALRAVHHQDYVEQVMNGSLPGPSSVESVFPGHP